MSREIQLDALSAPIEIGLRIILSIETADGPVETLEISKHGVLIPVQDQILDSKTLVPRPLVTDKISISKIKGSKLYSMSIDLPSKQKVYVSKELKDSSISIHVYRQFVDAWHPTNLAMLVISGKENVLYQDKRFLPGAVEQQIEVSSEEPSVKKVELEVAKEEVASIIPEPSESRFNFKPIARGIAVAFVFVFALVAVTPLALVHPNKLENQKSSIYLIWPSENPAVGSEVLVVDKDQLVFVAKVQSDDGGIIILQIDEYFVEITSDQVIGKKVISIQSPAQWFD